MLRHSPMWSLFVAASVGLQAHAAPIPGKDEPKKEEPKDKPGLIFPNLDDAFKNLQRGALPEDVRKRIEELNKQQQKMVEEMLKNLQPGALPGQPDELRKALQDLIRAQQG